MMQQTLIGPGFAAHLPPGFLLAHSEPLAGTHWLLPPGSDAQAMPAIVQLRGVEAHDLPGLLHNVHTMNTPDVALSMTNLGLSRVTAVNPLRQEQLSQGRAHIREFDAITVNAYPVRVIAMVIQGPVVAIEMIIMMNLYRWAEFIGPCLNFVSQLMLAGSQLPSGRYQAVVDQEHREQVEFQIVNSDRSVAPITSLPTSVGNITIINIDNSVRTGDIHGTGVVVGHHSTATVGQGGATG